jgi:hypothetical protein
MTIEETKRMRIEVFWMKATVETLEHYLPYEDIKKFKKDLLQIIKKYTTHPNIISLLEDNNK